MAVAILIIFQALIIGLIEKAVSNTTNLIVGEVQVHARGYLDDRSIYKSLGNIEKVRAFAKENNIGRIMIMWLSMTIYKIALIKFAI